MESASCSLSLVDEPLEKMEPGKMAPPKNAPRDALVSAGEEGPGVLEPSGPVRKAGPRAGWGTKVAYAPLAAG